MPNYRDRGTPSLCGNRNRSLRLRAALRSLLLHTFLRTGQCCRPHLRKTTIRETPEPSYIILINIPYRNPWYNPPRPESRFGFGVSHHSAEAGARMSSILRNEVRAEGKRA